MKNEQRKKSLQKKRRIINVRNHKPGKAVEAEKSKCFRKEG